MHGRQPLVVLVTAPSETVALEIGYSSVSAFIAVFKKAFGSTPRHFR